MKDGIGIYGAVLHYAFLFALIGSTLLVFIYLWRKGKLDMDEGAKEQMMKGDD
jgi:hypothetical protein